jgi:hypothetical protein
MTAQTGRTTQKWVEFLVDDSGGTLREIPVDSINGVGLTYDEVELTAFQDAIKGVLPAHPDCTITIGGPFDTSAAASAPTLSGSHTVLNGIVGAATPLALDVRIGIRHVWEAGEPTFGITGTTTAGFLCFDYQADVNSGKYTAKFRVYPGSTAPVWATAAHT